MKNRYLLVWCLWATNSMLAMNPATGKAMAATNDATRSVPASSSAHITPNSPGKDDTKTVAPLIIDRQLVLSAVEQLLSWSDQQILEAQKKDEHKRWGLDVEIAERHAAAWLGYTKALKELIDSGVDINSTDIFHASPMELAFNNYNLYGTLLLRNHGATIDPKWLTQRTDTTTILLAAASSSQQYASPDFVRLLLFLGANPYDTANGCNALQCAILHGREDFVRILLEWGVDPDTHTPDTNWRGRDVLEEISRGRSYDHVPAETVQVIQQLIAQAQAARANH